MHNLDQAGFQQLWQRLGGQGDADSVCAALLAAYTEPYRAYHALDHLRGCLARLAETPEGADQPAVAMALWFHDAVYDPHASDNEEQSAAWAAQALTEGGVALAVVEQIADLVLATKHVSTPASADAQLVVDVDLSFLGDSSERFTEYNRLIRQEYHWVPEAEYRRRRSEVLAGFLARPAIYHTAYFQTRYESQARRNLASTLAQLAQPLENV